jgi:hypothetical protein
VVECYTSNVDTRVRFPLGVNSLVLLQKEPGGGQQSSYYTGLAQSVERGPFSREWQPNVAGSSPAIGILIIFYELNLWFHKNLNFLFL